ncbi:thioredoxin [Nitzschia inconspicua]|uniref:Thioredoxin n=1 Tax=Nitzschia inconspicua TaxID=303405 RepID=A0A9K3KIG4_9STRA|nr:thioredoxin [Nitzschia inconspicua]
MSATTFPHHRRRRCHRGSKTSAERHSLMTFPSIIAFLVAMLATAAPSYCFAFSRQYRQSLSRIPNNNSNIHKEMQSTRWHSFQQNPSTTVRRSIGLYVAKTGGKMIDTEEQFAETVLAKNVPRPVMVFFSAPWCGPCRLTVPVVKDVMKQFSGDIDVVEICTDDLAEVAEDAGVVSIPTIQFYFAGKALETHSIVGCVAKTVLANAVEKVLEDVAQIQQQKAP